MKFFESDFRFLVGKYLGEGEIFRDIHIFISGPPAVCTGPSPTFRRKIKNNAAASSWHFPQLAHYVESRPGIAREYYLIR